MKQITTFALLLSMFAFVGCSNEKQNSPTTTNGSAVEDTTTSTVSSETLPAFVHTASEYPSWSTFMVAAKAGLINPSQGGEHGTLESKWGVDVVLQVQDYDPCITMYANGTCDSTCITDMDVLNPSLGRSTTVIMPTSTSAGADKIIAVGVNTVEDLKSVPTYGLAKSVSHYNFVRCLEVSGQNPSDFEFKNLDPAPAATALQTSSGDVQSISVWNPFALQTLRTNQNSKEILSSKLIAGEIVDCVVVGNDSLAKPKGKEYAACLCDIFYEVNKKLQSTDDSVANATLTALGEDFSKLPLQDMRIVVQETQFYYTPQDGIALFESQKFQTEIMPTVVKTCKAIGVLDENQSVEIGYGDSTKQLNFDTQYMKMVQ